MAFVPLPQPGGTILYVNPELVDAVEDVPGSSPAASFVSFIGDVATRETVSGTAAAVAALLDAGVIGALAASGTYAPPATTVSGPISLIAGFGALWSRVGKIVTVSARFDVSFFSGGTAAFSFPPPSSPALPLAGFVRGVVTCADNPYTGAPTADPETIVYESGPDFVIEMGNTVGGPKRVTVNVTYETP